MPSNADAKIRVLLVDDDEDEYLILRRIFSKISDHPFSLSWSGDYDESIRIINEKAHDIYLIDYRLGFRTGLDLLREVDARTRPEPFIILTNMSDNGVEFESIRLAASDYLIKKEITSKNLSRSLYYSLGRKEVQQTRIDELLRINASKDEFISIASHQLRTPATAVKQYLGILQDGLAGSLSEKQQQMLDKAYRNNERQLLIINDLLKVARIDSGHTKLNLKKLSIDTLVAEIESDISPALEAKNQTLITKLKRGATVKGDPELLRMAIDNLIENASKYSEENTTIRVTLRSHLNAWHLSIADNGVGISDTSRLFEKFSRIKNPLSNYVDGTGLGLYWARSVIRHHGGEVSYEANAPKGSIFTVILPANDTDV